MGCRGGCALAAAAFAHLASAELYGGGGDVDRHGSPGLSLSVGSVVLIVISVVLAACLVAVVLLQKQVRVSVFVSGIACACLILVGLVSWAASYVLLSDAIASRTEDLLDRTAMLPQAFLTTEIRNGVAAVHKLAAAARVGAFVPARGYPAGQLRLAGEFLASMLASSTLELLYYAGPGDSNAPSGAHGPFCVTVGRRSGRILAPRRANLLDAVQPLLVGAHFDPGDAVPDFLTCDADNRALAQLCDAYQCGSAAEADFACHATCAGQGTSSPRQSPRYCRNLDTNGTGPKRHFVMFPAAFDPVQGRFQASPRPGAAVPYMPEGSEPFDPTVRPWYHNGTVPRMSDPYPFILGGIGSTVSVGLFGPDGGFLGCAAVDFSMESLNALLKKSAGVIVHDAAVDMFVVDAAGYFIGTTWPWDALFADLGVPYNGTADNPPTEVASLARAARPNSRVMKAFQPLFDVHKAADPVAAIARLANRRTIVHAAAAVHISYPIDAIYQKYVLVVTLPFAHVTAQSDRASLYSLALVLGITLCCSAVLLALVTLCMRPLEDFARRLAAVADMQLDEPGEAQPRIAELVTMERAYALMIQRLTSYKEFLPQSVLIDSSDSEGPEDRSCVLEPGAVPMQTPTTDILTELTASPSWTATPRAQTPRAVHPSKLARGDTDSSHGIDVSAASSMEAHRARLEITDVDSLGTRASTRRPNPLVTRPSHDGESMVFGQRKLSKASSSCTLYTPKRFSMTVREQRVSLVCVVVHKVGELVGVEPWVVMHAQALALEHIIACAGKGVVDFNADEVYVAFNASKQVCEHRGHAVACAVAIRDDNKTTSDLSVAVASGWASAGNMGCDGLKKFNMIGDVTDAVREYAALGRSWSVPLIATEDLFEDHRLRFERRRLYPAHRRGTPVILCQVLDAFTVKEEEWMYQMAAIAASPFRDLDRVLGLVFGSEGPPQLRYERASAMLKSLNTRNSARVAVHADNLQEWLVHLMETGERVEPVQIGLPPLLSSAATYIQHVVSDLPPQDDSFRQSTEVTICSSMSSMPHPRGCVLGSTGTLDSGA